MSTLLEVRHLVAGYGGAPVLAGLDLAVSKGTITAVLGANGAGKTTLLRTLSGVLRPAAGQLRFDGRDLVDVPMHRRVRLGLAHVPEGGGVIGELSVEENLRLGGLWRGRPPDLDRVFELFPPLRARRGYAGHQLSGGERQMLALGRALLAEPSLLLLDEPSLGLAPQAAWQIMALLGRLRDADGLTVLLVEQNVRSALAIADQAIVMVLGRVVAAGPATVLRDDADLRHRYLGF